MTITPACRSRAVAPDRRSPDAALRLAGLIRAGLLKLDGYEIAEFGLSDANAAVAHAAANSGPFKLTVLRP